MERMPAIPCGTLRDSYLNRSIAHWHLLVVLPAGPQRICDKVETDLYILWNITKNTFLPQSFWLVQRCSASHYAHTHMELCLIQYSICGCRSWRLESATYSYPGGGSTSTRKRNYRHKYVDIVHCAFGGGYAISNLFQTNRTNSRPSSTCKTTLLRLPVICIKFRFSFVCSLPLSRLTLGRVFWFL